MDITVVFEVATNCCVSSYLNDGMLLYQEAIKRAIASRNIRTTAVVHSGRNPLCSYTISPEPGLGSLFLWRGTDGLFINKGCNGRPWSTPQAPPLTVALQQHTCPLQSIKVRAKGMRHKFPLHFSTASQPPHRTSTAHRLRIISLC